MSNKVKNLIDLVRWPNLLFIAVTQFLFHFCIVKTSTFASFGHSPLNDRPLYFWLLMAASIFIAAGGYVINDYFDVNIDRINKPEKLIIDRHFSRRTGIWLHAIFTTIGLLLSFWISFQLRNPIIAIGNVVVSVLLWIYSTTYKRELLIGNIIVSALTAWVILVLLAAELPIGWQKQLGAGDAELRQSIARLIRIAMLYSGFAFILSLIREVVKDMEDVEGDRRESCRTLPIRFGTNASKVFTGNWVVMLITMIVITLVYVLQFRWYIFSIYLAFTVIPMVILAFIRLFKSRSKADFGKLSSFLKWIMLAGIASMLFFLHYPN